MPHDHAHIDPDAGDLRVARQPPGANERAEVLRPPPDPQREPLGFGRGMILAREPRLPFDAAAHSGAPNGSIF